MKNLFVITTNNLFANSGRFEHMDVAGVHATVNDHLEAADLSKETKLLRGRVRPAKNHPSSTFSLPALLGGGQCTTRLCLSFVFLCWAAGLMCAHAEDDESSAQNTWDGQRIAELARKLTDEAYGSREEASQELAKAPVTVMPVLEQLAHAAEDPEAGIRLRTAARTLFVKWIAKRLPQWNMGRGRLGINWSISEEEPGVLLTDISADTAADRAGLEDDDIIVAINGKRFEKGVKREDVARIWRNMFPDDRMEFLVKRADKAEPIKLVAVVGSAPKNSSLGSGRPSEEEKAENLWQRYHQGRLDIPIQVQVPIANSGKRYRLQCWPTVLQSAKPDPKSKP